jgi:hypothetical protein
MESAFIILKMHCVGGLVFLSMVFAAARQKRFSACIYLSTGPL